MVLSHIDLMKVPGLYYMTKSDSRVQVTGCGSCGYLLLSLEVFSPEQILLTVQTTVIAQCFLSLFFLDFFILEFKKCVTFILLFCFIFWSSISFSVLLSVLSVLYVFLSLRFFIISSFYLFFRFFYVFFSALYLLHPSILFYLSFCPMFCSFPLYLFTYFLISFIVFF